MQLQAKFKLEEHVLIIVVLKLSILLIKLC